jgi:hypothetical protein
MARRGEGWGSGSRATGGCERWVLHIASGEAYDFEFQPDTPGEIPLEVENPFNKSKMVGKIVVE